MRSLQIDTVLLTHIHCKHSEIANLRQGMPFSIHVRSTSCAGGRHNMPPPPVTLTFDILTLKVVSESRVTWATSVPTLVFPGLSVLDLGPMYATDRQTSDSIIA